MEMSEFASPNANRFHAKCESFPHNACESVTVVLRIIRANCFAIRLTIFRCAITRLFIQHFMFNC